MTTHVSPSDLSLPHYRTSTLPVQPVVYPLPDREQELRLLKRDLIGVRRAQLKLVQQIEGLIEAVDTALLRY